jgi:predicted nuclease of predicted toxin-antitoxin system
MIFLTSPATTLKHACYLLLIGNGNQWWFVMKLLFDANLSPRLINCLQGLYPNSLHVRDVSLGQASDGAIWHYARNEGFVIVTKDSDFHELSLLMGIPPKVIWIRRKNCPTQRIEEILRVHYTEIQTFDTDSETSCLILI